MDTLKSDQFTEHYTVVRDNTKKTELELISESEDRYTVVRDSNSEIKNEVHTDHYSVARDHGQKTSSLVWKYFGNLKKNGEIYDMKHVYCTKCFEESKTKKYQKSTSTGNLIKHLKKAHNIMEQPSYRIKKDKNSIIVTKEESNYFYEEPECYNLDGTHSKFLTSITSTQEGNGSQENDPESQEYLIHDINEILIQEIAKRPQIYDSRLCTKNKSQIRRDLWEEIYGALNHLIPYNKLPKIWKNIRDRYQKIKKDMERDGRTTRPKYRYFDMLCFLDNIPAHSRNVSSPQHAAPSVGAVEENSARDQEPLESYNVSNFIFLNENVEQNDDARDMNNLDPMVMEGLQSVKQEMFSNNDGVKCKRIKLDDINNRNSDPDSILSTIATTSETEEKYHQLTTAKYIDIAPHTIKMDTTLDLPTSTTHQHIVHSSPLQQLQHHDQSEITENCTSSHQTEDPHVSHQQQPQQSSIIQSVSTIKCITSTPKSNKSEEFTIFGSYVAEVLKNMNKQKARRLQMKMMQFINEVDEDSD